MPKLRINPDLTERPSILSPIAPPVHGSGKRNPTVLLEDHSETQDYRRNDGASSLICVLVSAIFCTAEMVRVLIVTFSFRVRGLQHVLRGTFASEFVCSL